MKYKFETIANGMIAEGYTHIQIIDGEAEITTEAEKVLAEKSGGVPVKKVTKKAEVKDGPDS